KKAHIVAISMIALTALVVVAGFFIIGTPADMRHQRLDAERVMDLQMLQWELVNYYQQKEALPETLDALSNPITGFTVPTDPETGAAYRYEAADAHTFTLCATFSR